VFGGEIFVKYEDGNTHYQDALGRTSNHGDHFKKQIDELKPSIDDLCGCGSNFKYKDCCKNVPIEFRTSWTELSIRERNLAFCRAIKDVLGLNSGKTWTDVRQEMNEEQIVELYQFYSYLWPIDTDIYSLIPKPDGKYRAVYSGLLDTRMLIAIAIPSASLFDEFLIQSPIINPNNVKPEFSPIHSPSSFKYKALKDFAMMLELEPYIGTGLINLIPDPSSFNQAMITEVLNMATMRKGEVSSEKDSKVIKRFYIEDLLNFHYTASHEFKVQLIRDSFGVPEVIASEYVDAFDANAEKSSLVALQETNSNDSGQIFSFSMEPNYEMAMFLAQVTGSVIVTDSESRWIEFQKAQHTVQGIPSYPLDIVSSQIKILPSDYMMLDNLRSA